MSKKQRDLILEMLERQDDWKKQFNYAVGRGNRNEKYDCLLEPYKCGFYDEQFPPFVAYSYLDVEQHYQYSHEDYLEALDWEITTSSSRKRKELVTNIMAYVLGITRTWPHDFNHNFMDGYSFEKKFKLLKHYLVKYPDLLTPDSKFADDLLLALLFEGTYILAEPNVFESNGKYEPVDISNLKNNRITLIVSVMQEFVNRFSEFDFSTLKDNQGNAIGDLLLRELADKFEPYYFDEILDFINQVAYLSQMYGADFNNQEIGGINILKIAVKKAMCIGKPKQELDKFDSIIRLIENFDTKFDFNRYGKQIIELLEGYVKNRIEYLVPTKEHPEYETMHRQLLQKLEDVKLYIKMKSNPNSYNKEFLDKMFELYRLEGIIERCEQFSSIDNSYSARSQYDNIGELDIDILLTEKSLIAQSELKRSREMLVSPDNSIGAVIYNQFLRILETGKITETDKYGLLFLEGIIKQNRGVEYPSCPINGTVADILLWLKGVQLLDEKRFDSFSDLKPKL